MGLADANTGHKKEKITKASLTIIQCPKFHPVDPHFPIRIAPLVPWIRTGKKITPNGHIQNQIKIVIEWLAILIVKSFLKIPIKIDLEIWVIVKIEF